MRSENASFDSYAFDDIEHGAHLKIDHSITCKESSMLNLISQPIEKLQAMRAESAAKEDFAYYDAINSARQWENQAAVTRRLERAIEYLNVPETEHTSNKWVKGKDNYDYSKISNRVYTMSYRIYERSSWRSDAKKYDVNWFIYTNSPKEHSNIQIAGQERVCNSREEAEKYIQGRIKAYSHLFSEISPPIPKEHEKPFMVYGQLLPGYVTEEMQAARKAQETEQTKKASIREQLNSLKAQEKPTPQKQPKTRSEPEL